jgi:hypothetical protein
MNMIRITLALVLLASPALAQQWPPPPRPAPAPPPPTLIKPPPDAEWGNVWPKPRPVYHYGRGRDERIAK